MIVRIVTVPVVGAPGSSTPGRAVLGGPAGAGHGSYLLHPHRSAGSRWPTGPHLPSDADVVRLDPDAAELDPDDVPLRRTLGFATELGLPPTSADPISDQTPDPTPDPGHPGNDPQTDPAVPTTATSCPGGTP
jgi:hypothetical protein